MHGEYQVKGDTDVEKDTERGSPWLLGVGAMSATFLAAVAARTEKILRDLAGRECGANFVKGEAGQTWPPPPPPPGRRRR